MRRITAGATSPALKMTCLDDGVALDVSTATAKTITITNADRSSTIQDDAALTFTSDGTDGQVEYAWQASDTATPGVLLLKVTLTWPGGGVTKFPDSGFEQVEVTDDL